MRFPFKVGLKLYSINTDLIPEILALWHRDFFDYIELYIAPGSYSSTYEIWRSCNIPFLIHAAHSYDGINLACRMQWKQNLRLFREAQRFADILDAEAIVIHGGMNGTIEETIYQAKRLSDSRLVLENKPKIAIRGEACVGWSPEEFYKAYDSKVFKGFVLDFGHAECAAFSVRKKPMDMISEFLDFDPSIYHIADGVTQSEKDTHRNFGKGDRKLNEFIKVLPQNACATIETPKDLSKGLKDFIDDLNYLETYLIPSAIR